MKLRVGYLLLLLLASIQLSAQSDTLALTYHTEFEQGVFAELDEVAAQRPLDLFLAADSTMSQSERSRMYRQLESVMAALEDKNLRKKPVDKAVKIIFKTVQEELLKRYEIDNLMSNVFRAGEYNCVSVSAIYAIVLQRFGIPYSIQELPTHVFVMATDNGEQILMEGTDPEDGYRPINARFKQQYLKAIPKHNAFVRNYIENRSPDELFELEYEQSQPISIRQLAALHYYNQGAFLMDDSAYSAAQPYLQKAQHLYGQPSDVIDNTRLYCDLIVALSDSTWTRNRVDVVARFYNIAEMDEVYSNVVTELWQLGEQQVATGEDSSLFGYAWRQFAPLAPTDAYRDTLDYCYHRHMAAYHLMHYKALPSLQHMWQATDLEKDPTITADTSLFARAEYDLLKLVLLQAGTTDARLATLDSLGNHRAALSGRSWWPALYAKVYLRAATNAFWNERHRLGEEWLAKAEKSLFKAGDNAEPTWIEEAYNAAWAYYCRVPDFRKARSAVDRGLQFCPDCEKLLRDRKHLNEGGY